MHKPLPEYPTLTSEHLSNARLFANREDLIRALPIKRGGIIAEVGVARGEFSEFLITALKPSKFVAFDLFTSHELDNIFGMSPLEYFGGFTQIEHYRRRLDRYADIIVIEHGNSHETLPRWADHSFDLVYIDADHSYDSVRIDAICGAKMTTDGGILVFNDYILLPEDGDAPPYGVVPVVNEMAVNANWYVIGFALNRSMFCDIALQRVPR